jgi:uncharacterized membrane protein YhaH (DUF805 family)
MQKKVFWLPFSQLFLATGRVNRLQYLVYFLILVAALFAVMAIIDFGLVRTMNASTDLEAVPSAIFVYMFFCLVAKRLHDLKLPAVIGLVLVAVPVAQGYFDAAAASGASLFPASWAPLLSLSGSAWNLVSGLSCLLLFGVPGSPGDNRYGPAPVNRPVEAF